MLPATPFWRGSDGAKRVVIFPLRPGRPNPAQEGAQTPRQGGPARRRQLRQGLRHRDPQRRQLGHAARPAPRHRRPLPLGSASCPAGAEHAPLVTAAALRACLEAISERVVELTGLGRGYDVTGARLATGEVTAAVTNSSGVVVPGNREGVADTTYGRKGKVTDGREPYVRSRAFRYAIANRPLLATEAGAHAVAGRLFEECKEVFDGLGSGRYSAWGDEAAAAPTPATPSSTTAAPSWKAPASRRGDARPIRQDRRPGRERPQATRGPDRRRHRPGSRRRPRLDRARHRVPVRHHRARPGPQGRRARPAWARRGARRGSAASPARVRATIDRVPRPGRCTGRNAKAPLTKVILMRAPVGAGKTSTFIERIAARSRRGKPSSCSSRPMPTSRKPPHAPRTAGQRRPLPRRRRSVRRPPRCGRRPTPLASRSASSGASSVRLHACRAAPGPAQPGRPGARPVLGQGRRHPRV